MTASAEHPAFIEWLETATRGLPPQSRAAVRAELTAHYLDTVEAHRAVHIPEAESHLLALAELGDPRDTARGLQAAHLPVRRLVVAMGASLLFTVLVGALSLVQGYLNDVLLYLILDSGLLLTGLIVLPTFQHLPQLQPARLEKPVSALVVSLVLGIGGRLVYSMIYGRTMVEPTTYYFAPSTPLPETLIFLLFIASQLLTGIAMLWLAGRLIAVPDSLFGLRLPIQALLAVMGVAGVGLAAALVLNAADWIEWFSLAGNGGLVIVLTLMALLFFRVVYRPAALRTPTSGASS